MTDINSNVTNFLTQITELIRTDIAFKLTFSKPRHVQKNLLNVYVKPAKIKQEWSYSLTYHYTTKDEVKNYKKETAPDIFQNLMVDTFYNAVLFYDHNEWTLLQNKKGKSSLIRKKISESININTNHDHQKHRFVPADRNWLKSLGLAGKSGVIHDKSQDKFRQINKFVEIVDHLIRDYPRERKIHIADMGSGKGYLTFGIYDFLTNALQMKCRMTGYELREDIVSLCNQVASDENFTDLDFRQKSIQDTDVEGIDMVIALHACDIATDMAIAKGIQANARYIIVSPCCHKQIRKSMHYDNVLKPVLNHGILEERQAEILTDGIRALIMEAYGYKTQVFEFISTEHTSKNLMITGIQTKPNPAASEQVAQIKKMFGIPFHYLETLLSPKEI